ncbi:MAG: hypothetical protein KH828_12470 [Clostridiales bacterium]|nr:hypothetical protein [Clostridiales bacterium]
MKDCKKQLEMTASFLQKAGEEDGTLQRGSELLEHMTEDKNDGEIHWLARTSQWLIPAKAAEDGQILWEFRELWNRFIRKMLSAMDAYRYTSEEEYRRDLNRLRSLWEQQQERKKKIYLLKDKRVAASESFTGREELICELHERLKEKRVVALYGIGGIGKSELAKAYAQRYAADYETIVFSYFHDSLQEVLIDDTQVPVENLRFQSTGKRGERGYYFRKKLDIIRQLVDQKTLLIFDDFDVMSDARLSAVTSLPCRILFTSRTEAGFLGLSGIRVPAFDNLEEQRNLFLKYYGKELSENQVSELDELLKILNGHTLSIKLCALYLAETGEAVKNMTRQLQKKEANDVQEQIQNIFRISDLNRTERSLMRSLSVLPVQGIKISQFMEYCGLQEKILLRKLAAYGLAECDEERDWISLHPLIAATVRRTEKVSFRNCGAYVLSLCKLGCYAWNKHASEKEEFKDYLYYLVQILQDTEKEPFDDLVFLVDACWQLGYFTLAEKFGLKMNEYCQKKYKTTDKENAHIKHTIASIYDNWGKRDKAKEWYRAAYQEYTKCPEPNLYYRALVSQRYGRTLRYEKNYREAEIILLDAQEYLGRRLKEHPLQEHFYEKENVQGLLMAIYMELAEMYFEWGKVEKSLAWLKRREEEYRDREIRTEASQWHLYYIMGRCQMTLNHLEDAYETLSRALWYAEQYMVEGSPFTCMVLEALGELMIKMGNPEEAERWFRKKKDLEKKTSR